MTEGKGYCARRQENRGLKRLGTLVENRDKILVIPEVPENRKRRSNSRVIDN